MQAAWYFVFFFSTSFSRAGEKRNKKVLDSVLCHSKRVTLTTNLEYQQFININVHPPVSELRKQHIHRFFTESPVKTHSDVLFTSAGFTVMTKISCGSQVNSPPPRCPCIVGTRPTP